MLVLLSADTPASEVKQRPAPGSSGKTLSYIDARFVFDRLDEAVRPENWQNRFERDSKGILRCGIGINIEVGHSDGPPTTEWIWKWDTGDMSNIEGNKGEHSDAIKRSGVLWGIARDLYEERGPAGGAKPAGRSTSGRGAAPVAGEMYSSWKCPSHGGVKVIPAGTSRKTGRAYPAFAVCDVDGCEEKPPRGHKLATTAPASTGYVGMADDVEDGEDEALTF